MSGPIGKGQSINLSLYGGYHLVTLTVTDSQGLSNTTYVEIFIIQEISDEETNERNEHISLLLLLLLIFVSLIIIVTCFIWFLNKGEIDWYEE